MSHTAWNTKHNFLEVDSKLRIHPVVDERVDARVGHCKPVEEKIEVTDVCGLSDGGFMENSDEVDMVWSPADHEDENNESDHFDNLKVSNHFTWKKKGSNPLSSCWLYFWSLLLEESPQAAELSCLLSTSACKSAGRRRAFQTSG